MVICPQQSSRFFKVYTSKVQCTLQFHRFTILTMFLRRNGFLLESTLRLGSNIFIQLYFFNLYCIGLHGLKMDNFVKWLTGSKSIPPLGFPKKIAVKFVHGCKEGCRCRPTTSTCDILKLPVHITSVEDMGLMIESAVKESVGFGLI